MKPVIHCKNPKHGQLVFYLRAEGEDYFLFTQRYRTCVNSFFARGVSLNEAMNRTKAHGNPLVNRTLDKIYMHVKYIEKEYEIEVYEKSRKQKKQRREESPICLSIKNDFSVFVGN